MKKMTKNLHLIGAAIGVGAQNQGCVDGPIVIQQSTILSQLFDEQTAINLLWQNIIREPQDADLTDTQIIANCCQHIAQYVKELIEDKQLVGVIGGNHTCAIGTWAGVHVAIKNKGPLGLIWIDAHLDSHTPETSESGAIYGMPLAILLGHGDKALTHLFSNAPIVYPENVCIIGARSFEKGEYELIKKLGVKVFYMDEVKQCGIKPVLDEAIAIVEKNTAAFGISIDLDAIDPNDAPGVSLREKDGISGIALIEALQSMADKPKFCGFEIAEFNPHLDKQQKTEKIISQLIMAMAREKSQ